MKRLFVLHGEAILATLIILLLAASCTEVVSNSRVRCTKDSACPSGLICDTGGQCREPADQCRTSTDCANDETCINRLCEEAFCATDCDCMVDAVCNSGYCDYTTTQCYSDNDCEDGWLCDYKNIDACQQRRCLPGECQTDSECEGASICLDNRCRMAECYYALDCNPEDICHAFRCMPPECGESASCDAGFLCHIGFCEAFLCDESGECPLYSVCRQDFCRPISCIDDMDCGLPEVCELGFCRTPECARDEDCLPVEACVERRCLLDFNRRR